LTTKTTTANELGYTLSAYSIADTGISITKDGGANPACSTTIPLSNTKSSPTEIEVTSGYNDPPGSLNTTITTYCVVITDNNITDGEYSVTIGYHLAENKPLEPPTSFADFSSTYCNNYMEIGDIITINDERNGQDYRVKKMQDSKCWMIDNLKYLPTTNYPNGQQIEQVTSDNFMTGDGTSYNQSTANFDKAFYANPAGTTYCDTTVYTENSASKTGCGYLYNWYAATNGTGTYLLDSEQATGSICPANFRLPTGGSTGDFAYLNAYMAGVTPPSTVYDYYDGWQPAGSWQGVFSGIWFENLLGWSDAGYFWSSSTAIIPNISNAIYAAAVTSNNASPAYYNANYYGFAVRCVAS
jgi:uncharacterized protein (TIGR02145 family)